MKFIAALVLSLSLGSFFCAQQQQSARAPAPVESRTAPATIESRRAPAPSPDATSPRDDSRREPSPSQSLREPSQSESLREPSIEELQRAVPPELLKEERCSIEEEVEFSPQTGRAPLTVSFDAGASRAPCGKVVRWKWNFGDGAKGEGRTVKHTFSAPGSYTVTLEIEDEQGHVNLAPLDYEVTVTGQPARER